MIRSILYPTDLGPYAPYVLQHALILARGFSANVHLLHVVEPIGLFAESVLTANLGGLQVNELRQHGYDAVMQGIEQQVRGLLDEDMRLSDPEASCIHSIRVVQGDPPQAILDEARVLTPDLIVVGCSSQGGGRHAPIGRTAQRLIQLSSVPIYLVPMPRSS